METRRQDSDIISHQFRGQQERQGEREEAGERKRAATFCGGVIVIAAKHY